MQEVRAVLVRFVTAVAVFSLLLTVLCQAQTEKIIHSFSGGTDGNSPVGGLILDTNGNLYGATPNGGTNYAGTVFELSPGSGGTWINTVLYSFGVGPTGGLPIQTWSLMRRAICTA